MRPWCGGPTYFLSVSQSIYETELTPPILCYSSHIRDVGFAGRLCLTHVLWIQLNLHLRHTPCKYTIMHDDLQVSEQFVDETHAHWGEQQVALFWQLNPREKHEDDFTHLCAVVPLFSSPHASNVELLTIRSTLNSSIAIGIRCVYPHLFP
ncbi:hypothetical protein JAAARDRAFT_300154 [Jaapia argillacea MUCL 33604]|uniref:Uncharacterized protein n=1 Tax=Jaapia argillacea MUCL 33604 TaxID=933084 RepID=A0A067PPM7_9AGAM|nr:hypothetical protein JAAARDRAFT_300154 [Jaapia argillacea MUCL 33604]